MSCKTNKDVYILNLFVLEDVLQPKPVIFTTKPTDDDINDASNFAKKKLSEKDNWQDFPARRIIDIIVGSFKERMQKKGYCILSHDEKDVWVQP